MDVKELLLTAAAELTRRKIPYMVVGGIAVGAWCDPPRATDDVDLIVYWPKRLQATLREALIAVGAKPTSTSMRVLFEKTWTRFNAQGVKLDIHIASSRHDHEARKHAVPLRVETTIPVVGAEDLLLYKLKAWREQDQVDAIRLIREVANLDRAYLESWLDSIAERENCPMRERWADARRRAGNA